MHPTKDNKILLTDRWQVNYKGRNGGIEGMSIGSASSLSPVYPGSLSWAIFFSPIPHRGACLSQHTDIDIFGEFRTVKTTTCAFHSSSRMRWRMNVVFMYNVHKNCAIKRYCKGRRYIKRMRATSSGTLLCFVFLAKSKRFRKLRLQDWTNMVLERSSLGTSRAHAAS